MSITEPDMSRILIIYNPFAGRGRAKGLWPQILRGLLDQGLEFDFERTQGPLHAGILAEQAGDSYSTVVAVGGDGTVHEVANGLLRASKGTLTKALGIIPVGNGDDFVKMLPPATPVGKQAFSWKEAIGKISGGQTHVLDAGRISMLDGDLQEDSALRYFVNGLNLGFSAHAAFNFTTIPHFLTGAAGYLAAVVKTLWHYPSLNLQVRLDDQQEFSLETSMVAIMNGRCFGRSFWVCPQADAEDGLLEMMVTKKVGRLTILRKVPLMMKGQHLHDPLLNWYRGSKIQIRSNQPLIVEADGEIPFLNARQLEIEVLHKCLKVIV